MGKFLEDEKPRQTAFKKSSKTFSVEARKDGIYKNKARPFCLPLEFAEENLIPEIRETALAHFAEHKIKWHDGQNGKPSNHLCDSQVCCVNFLFPLADKPDELAEIFRRIYPEIGSMLPIESGRYVSFEWIGEENYLGERISRNGQRARGANCTSADAIVMFKDLDKKRRIILIEWKYTESYSENYLKFASSGTDRTEIYRHLFQKTDCPVNKDVLPSFDTLFYEPFYQFMRQQFLAHEMEKAREMGADNVSVLHIAPNHILDFRKITSPELKILGEFATDVWGKLVSAERRFITTSSEDLFGKISVEKLPKLKSWEEYIYTRYDWMNEI